MQAFVSEHLRAMAAAVRTTPVPVGPGHPGAPPPVPFVTISRQGGAGGRTIGNCLIQRLNELDPGEEPWLLWDKELVEKVAAEHHLSADSVAKLGESHRGWFEEFVSSLSQGPSDDEVKVFRRVAMSIRALAQQGRAVIVGRGGAYITRRMPGGVHCRLIAPLAYRIGVMAKQLGISQAAAAEQVRILDHNRQAFLRRYWPSEAGNPEVFTVAINTSLVTEEQAAEALLPLVLGVRRMASARHQA